MTLSEYMQAQMQHGLQQQGYSETPGPRSTLITNDIASVRQQFTMNFVDAGSVDAVDIFSLARIAGQWRIVSVVSDISASQTNSG